MAWIESHQSLLRHKKTARAVRALGIDIMKFIGHMHALWWWGLDNASPDGDIGDSEDAEIEFAACWDGEDGAFVRAITKAGFIDDDGSGRRSLHDWWDYAGKIGVQREKAREGARQRQADWRERNSKRNHSATVTGGDSNALLNVSVTPDNGPTQPDPTQPNQENPLTPRCGGDEAVAASEGPGASRPRPPSGGAGDATGERPAKRSHPGLADPDCRSIADAGFEALKAAGVSNLPQDWWRRAAISAHGTIRRGTAPPTAAEVRSAIAWSMDPERWQYKRGDLLHRRFGLLLADYQAASADVVPENRRAPAPAAPVVDHAARLVALALEGLGPDGRPLEPEPQPAGPFVLPPWSKRAKAAETGSRGP